MIKLKILIERIFTKKNIKIFLLLFVVAQFFIWTSFAASNWESSEIVKHISYLLHIFISILSWVWILLATLAWKLMTNDFVYWSFIHLDKVLWDLWNIMKNFANFALWLILVGTIIKNLFKWSFGKSDGDPIKGAKDTIIHTLIAWVLVQMSRFLMAAMLDLSTIATAAVWSIPSQFMVNTMDFQAKMTAMIPKTTTKLNIDLTSSEPVKSMKWIDTGHNTTGEIQKLFDTIMPSTDSLAWPLMFLWASVFNLYELSDTSNNVSGTNDIWDLILSLWINWFVLFSFSLMLALIFVFNLFRVITLWIVIPLTPFVVLLNAFKKDNLIKNFGGKNLGGVLDYKKIIKLVFKPVYMTLVLSIILIVMVLIRSLAKANGGFIEMQEQSNMTVRSTQTGDYYDSSLDVAGIANVKLHMRESIVDLIVYIFWLALMFMLMKSCMSGEITWIKFIDEKISKLSGSIWWNEKWMKIWWLLWSVWVVPIGGEKVWINSIRKMGESALGNWENLARAVGIDLSEQDRRISELLWKASFASLNLRMSRDEWINKAVLIWKEKHYIDVYDMMKKSDEFKEAMNKWNDYHKKKEDQIRPEHIDAVRKGEKPG